MDGVVGCPKLIKARRHISLRFIMNESFPRVFWVCKQCAGEQSRHRREECEEPGTPASAGTRARNNGATGAQALAGARRTSWAHARCNPTAGWASIAHITMA